MEKQNVPEEHDAEQTESKAGLVHKLSTPLGVAGSLVALLGAAWGVIAFFNPIENVDLTVWIKQEINVSLPTQASSLKKLALTYDGNPIEQASLLEISVANTGRASIGRENPDGKPTWSLKLKSASGAPIEQVGELQTKPSNLTITSSPAKSNDAILLNFGLMNVKDAVELRLAIVGPTESGMPIKAETRVPGLSEPVVTRSTLRERIAEEMSTPIAIVAVPLLLFVMLYSEAKEGWSSFREKSGSWASPWRFVWMGVVALFASLLGGIMIAGGLAWVLSWIVYGIS